MESTGSVGALGARREHVSLLPRKGGVERIDQAQSQAELVAFLRLSEADTTLAICGARGSTCWTVGDDGSAVIEVERAETDD